jgi:glycosyltransferase involved in cell wall biosynthesis
MLPRNCVRRRVLIVTDAGLFWPSGMIRVMQFKPLFDSSLTWRAEYASRHPESLYRLFSRRYGGLRRVFLNIARPMLERIERRWTEYNEDRIVRDATSFDLICIVKTPALGLCRRLGALNGPRILIDISDAVWSPRSRAGGWRSVDEFVASAHGVICENDCVAAYASRHNRKVFVISDAPQLEVYDRFRAQTQRDPNRVVLGYVGSSSPESSGALFKIWEPLELLFARYPHLHLRLLGIKTDLLPAFENVRYSCVPAYDQERMVRELLGFDIGLFPLFHNEDGRGRGTLKAKNYLSAEVAAVCENFGENSKLIRDGINGLLATGPEQWYAKIEHLVLRPQERLEIARRGLETIRTEYTAQHVFARMLAAYDEVMSQGN